ncbi:hypothetical protein NQ314_005772 [Rhamnusium bicolor]|uniref:tRNA synthetases class I catalytic domain-containing protein n=1 Tax=Rhamnusium bicolor TaxID=1586634 RepID=A0AAV8ZCU9_9CUCU|nr:hypothetical protein NQ314_005772 [Rhamnusium bicolor]
MAWNPKLILQPRKCFLKYRFNHNWVKPEGFDTGIKVYNCITRKKEPLIVKNKHILTWYTCGPTVYDSSHIGHASCYVKLDIIQKILRDYFKYNLVTVMNITDIDDKIIKKANQTNRIYNDIAKEYEKEFLTDLRDLGINKPNIILRVTENIDLIIEFIKKLESDDQAYKSSDNSVYFNMENYNNYGKLQNIGTSQQRDKSNLKKIKYGFCIVEKQYRRRTILA